MRLVYVGSEVSFWTLVGWLNMTSQLCPPHLCCFSESGAPQVLQNLGHFLFSDLGICRALSSVFAHAFPSVFTFSWMCYTEAPSALLSFGQWWVHVAAVRSGRRGTFWCLLIETTPATKTLSHQCSTAHEREMFCDHQKRDGDNRWIATKHQGLSLQNSSLAGNDRQVEEGQC